MNLSREDAAALGIVGEFYDEALRSIEDSNNLIQQLRKEYPNVRLNLELPSIEELETRASVLPPESNNPKSLFGLQPILMTKRLPVRL